MTDHSRDLLCEMDGLHDTNQRGRNCREPLLSAVVLFGWSVAEDRDRDGDGEGDGDGSGSVRIQGWWFGVEPSL